MSGFLKYVVCIIFFICILSTLVELVDNDSKSSPKIKKLQIGIKKRVEGCEIKSKKGDVLHMHYKVIFLHFHGLMAIFFILLISLN